MEFGKKESKTATLIISNLYLQLFRKRDKIDISSKGKNSIYFQYIKRKSIFQKIIKIADDRSNFSFIV